jgi:predicted alpha-1,6-mannanase (GH76 family)
MQQRAHLPRGRAIGASGAAALSACALMGAWPLMGACSLLVDTNADQCARDQDCAPFGGTRACVAGLCVRVDGGAAGDAADGVDAPPADARPEVATVEDAAGIEDASPGRDGAEAGAGEDAEQESAPPPPTLTVALANAWADEAVESLMLNFWQPGLSGGYLSTTPKGMTATSYWTFAQAWEAVLDAVERHAGARFAGTLRTLYLAQDAQGWSSPSFADENWMILALSRAHGITQEALYEYEASLLYAKIMNAWDTTCCAMPPGGVWTDQAHTGKGTAANAGAVINGAQFFGDFSNVEYLNYAQTVYDYWLANMVDATTHRVSDAITSAGQRSGTSFTVDQGLMIGAGIALAGAAMSTAPRDSAHANAQYMLAQQTARSPYGAVLSDGSCTGDCEQYKGIAARYLGQLYQADSMAHPEYFEALKASALGAHELARDPSSGAFAVDWSLPYSSQAAPPTLSATSSAARLLSAVASILGTPSDPAGVYEAEEAVLHGVGVEAKYRSFEGWGYVTGWAVQGQVDFLITVSADGPYDLTLRYAANGDNAARLVSINGTSTPMPIQLFPDTGSWETYRTVTITANLVAGQSTLTLASNLAAGTYNELSLDQLTVTAH